MITKINYDKQGAFTISGLLKTDFIDFMNQKIVSDKFFPTTIQLMIDIKKEVLKNLSDDNKILSEERIKVVDVIDKFLTMVLSLAFTVSDNKLKYSNKYKEYFEINLELNKTLYINGSGKLTAISSKDVSDYSLWIDERIIGSFKALLSFFNNKDNKNKINEELIKLIYNIFSLRYKIEYI